jgi:hypothetical protein
MVQRNIYNDYEQLHEMCSVDENHEWNGSYHRWFPNNWTLDHEPETGPADCFNCASYGCYKGEFIGYCANCAKYVYKGKRGRGFIDVCTELVDDDTKNWTSVFETYLQGAEFARFSDDNEVVIIDSDNDFDEDDDESTVNDNVEFIGQETIFESHFEGGYFEF